MGCPPGIVTPYAPQPFSVIYNMSSAKVFSPILLSNKMPSIRILGITSVLNNISARKYDCLHSNWTVWRQTCFFCQCIRAALPQTRPTTQIRIPLFPSAPFFFPAPSFSHKGSLETRLRSVHWIWHFEAPHFPVPCPAPGSFLPEIRLSDFPQNTLHPQFQGFAEKYRAAGSIQLAVYLVYRRQQIK